MQPGNINKHDQQLSESKVIASFVGGEAREINKNCQFLSTIHIFKVAKGERS